MKRAVLPARLLLWYVVYIVVVYGHSWDGGGWADDAIVVMRGHCRWTARV